MTKVRLIFTLALLLSFSGCALFEVKDSAPDDPIDVSQIKEAIPKPEPKSRYGNPQSYQQDGIEYRVLPSASGYRERGIASWYGTKFHGERTSSGETYDMYMMTAAHKTLPLPTFARVTHLQNGRSLVVRINDRGPFVANRIIDLSYAAAVRLGIDKTGTAEVEVTAIVPDGMHDFESPLIVPTGQKAFVQVGAFSSKQQADKLRQAIAREVPWKVHLSRVTINRKVLHRVRIGPIESLDEANRLVKTLSVPALGKPKIIFD